MLTNKDYCDYDTCVALKELGYPQHITEEAYIIDNYGEDECDIGERLPIPLIPDYMDVVAAPTIYEAQKWLREERGMLLQPTYLELSDEWICVIRDKYKRHGYSTQKQKDYEEVLLEGIKKTVELLKEVK